MLLSPVPAPRTWEPLRPFAFIAGHAALDLVNTVDWTEPQLSADRLTSYDRLIDWAVGAAVIRTADASAIRRAAHARAADSARALARARAVRHVLASVVRGLIHAPAPASALPAATALDAFRSLVADAHQTSVLVPARLSAVGRVRGTAPTSLLVTRWPWQDRADEATLAHLRLDSVLWPVLRDAEALLTRPDALAIKMCAGHDCGWLFLDASRGRRRRWCAMRTCGTIAKELRRGPREA